MTLHVITIKRIIALIMMLISIGCTKQVHTHLQIDETVTSLMDSHITCNTAPEDTCAIASEFYELAEEALKESSVEEPKHFVSFLNYGQNALLARIHLIRAAKKSIEVQTYIWANDEVGQLMFVELLRAARRGVNVRIIVDQITVTAAPWRSVYTTRYFPGGNHRHLLLSQAPCFLFASSTSVCITNSS
jgi:hypothetical protein